jgi:uncharacterized protein (DUF1015 family)
MEGPKKDRYSLLEATQANISPIFCMCDDENQNISQLLENYSKSEPIVSSTDITDTQHDLWKISDNQALQKISELVENKRIIILDGHHRYTTALNYKTANPERKNNFILTALVPDSDPGLKILPIHRMLKNTLPLENVIKILKKNFEIEQFNKNNTSINLAFEDFEKNKNKHGFLLTDNKQFYSCKIKTEKFNKFASQSFEMNLDTYIVDELGIKEILKEIKTEYLPEQNVNFITGFDEITSMFNKEPNNLCFLVKSLPIKTIENFAEQNMVMPHKTTYLYPKIGSGFVINKF